MGRDLDQDVLWGLFGVFDEEIKIAVVIKNAGVEQFVLKVIGGTLAICLDQIIVGIGRLRIFVQLLHIGMGGGAVQVEIVFLNIFAMIAFAVGQAKQPLFEDGIATVPQGQGKAELLLVIGQTGQPVFAPVIGT
jgi:hypothetical protein